MNEHAWRVIIWAIMSAISSGGFWIAYRNEIMRDSKSLLSAQDRYQKAGGLDHSLGLALGFKREASPDLLEAKEHVSIWQRKLNTDLSHRRNCMLACPGIIAIILLFAL